MSRTQLFSPPNRSVPLRIPGHLVKVLVILVDRDYRKPIGDRALWLRLPPSRMMSCLPYTQIIGRPINNQESAKFRISRPRPSGENICPIIQYDALTGFVPHSAAIFPFFYQGNIFNPQAMLREANALDP